MNEKLCTRLVVARDEGMCFRCGNVSRGVTRHHRKNRSQGGEWTPSNIVLACGHGTTPGGCHSWFGAAPKAAEAEGFHVLSWQDPADFSVLRRGVWVRLDDEGGFENV